MRFSIRLSSRVKYCYRSVALYRCSHISQAEHFCRCFTLVETVATVSTTAEEEEKNREKYSTEIITRRLDTVHRYYTEYLLFYVVRWFLFSILLVFFFFSSIVLIEKWNRKQRSELLPKKNFNVNDVSFFCVCTIAFSSIKCEELKLDVRKQQFPLFSSRWLSHLTPFILTSCAFFLFLFVVCRSPLANDLLCIFQRII